MRVISHPILGEEKETEWVTIYVNGKPIQAKKGEMILAALHAEGIIVNRYTAKKHEPRGIFWRHWPMHGLYDGGQRHSQWCVPASHR